MLVDMALAGSSSWPSGHANGVALGRLRSTLLQVGCTQRKQVGTRSRVADYCEGVAMLRLLPTTGAVARQHRPHTCCAVLKVTIPQCN
jgi:hypothetical protein